MKVKWRNMHQSTYYASLLIVLRAPADMGPRLTRTGTPRLIFTTIARQWGARRHSRRFRLSARAALPKMPSIYRTSVASRYGFHKLCCQMPALNWRWHSRFIGFHAARQHFSKGTRATLLASFAYRALPRIERGVVARYRYDDYSQHELVWFYLKRRYDFCRISFEAKFIGSEQR